jgi:pimeloyl-ACP methyl ester carboxylesterase
VGATLAAATLLPERTAADRLPRREYAGPHGRFVRLRGVEVHHEVHGPADAPALLLSHHFYGAVRVWDRLVPLLADRYRVVAWDRPGFGLTERPLRDPRGPNPYTRRAAAELGWALLDHLGIGETVLVGASAGGSNAIEMHEMAPHRVRGMALLAPAITGDVGAPAPLRPLLRTAPLRRIGPRIAERYAGEVTRERATRSWADPTRADDAVDLAPYRQLLRTEGWSRGLWEVMTAEAPPDLRAALRRIVAPTLVVTGERDRTIAPRWGRWVAGEVADGRFALLPDAGHVPHQERPAEVAELLHGFLADVLGR